MAGPSLASRIGAAVKAFRMRYPRSSGTGYGSAYGYLYGYPRFDNLQDPWPRTWFNRNGGDKFDPVKSAGEPQDNAAVVICLSAIAWNFPEPVLEVSEKKEDGSEEEAIEGHAVSTLLQQPNEIDDFYSLTAAWSSDYCVDGNAYLLKERTRGQEVAQLQWIPSFQIEPFSDDPYVAVQYYRYRVDGKEEKIPPRDIIHFRQGKDPHNPRKGCSALKKIIYELAADNEASIYTATILSTLGVVGGILSNVDPDVELDEPEAERIKALYREQFTGHNRGGLMVPTFKSEYTELGRSPEQMALDKIRGVPEARICAALRVPAMVAGLSVGDNQRTYANYAEAREAFYEDCLIPLHGRFCAGLTRHLLLTDFKGTPKQRVRMNYDDVRVLQPDLDKLTDRVGKAYKAYGLLTLNEARTKLGEKAVEGPEGEQRYMPAPKPLPGEVPESQGDRAANERTPPFGAEAGLNGKHVKAAAADLKRELGEKWRQRRRAAEEGQPPDADGE